MAKKFVARFQYRRGTEAAWIKNNPILAQGEPGFVIDKGYLKIGDGKSRWQELPPFNEDGKSAYEIAVEYGFNGSEKQWLDSLKGAQGPQGPQGPQGVQGVRGPQGETPVKGEDYFTPEDIELIVDETISKIEESNNSEIVSENSLAYGNENIAGLKGYYYSTINFGDKITITLSTKQDETIAPTNLIWEVGDIISINNSNRYNLCSTITAVNGNVITVDSLPFEKVITKEEIIANGGTIDFSNWSIAVPAKPTAGEVDLGQGATAFGDNNESLNWGTFVAGRENEVTNAYSASLGRKNKVHGYASFVSGSKNEILPGADYSLTHGRENKVKGSCSIALGNVTEAKADCTFTTGSHTKATRKYQTAIGVNNKEDADALFVVGNGMTVDENGKEQPDYNNPKNAFVVKKDGTAYADGKQLVDKSYLGSAIWSKVDDIRAVKSGVALSTILRSGFYKLSDNHPDLPSSDSIWSQMIVSSDNASHTQIVFPKSGKAIYYRASEGGKYPAKWTTLFINNDMAIGVEYLTTEKHQNMPVYVKKVGISLMSDGERYVHISSNIANVVSIDGMIYESSNKYPLSKYSYIKNIYVNNSGYLVINSSSSGGTAYITVKYIKQ